MAGLHGKGIWLAHSYDLQRAVEMATGIEATHLMVKVGHGPIYFPETTLDLLKRVRSLGFQPLAWVQLTDRASQDAFRAVERALTAGYNGVVLSLGSGYLTARQIRPFADQLENVKAFSDSLYVATPPLAALPDRSVLEILAPYCMGGWMPFCFAAYGDSPEIVIDRNVYQALGPLSLLWGGTPAVYPVISPLQRLQGDPFLPEMFIPWIEGIIRHGIDFFSVDHAAVTEKVLWPLIQSIGVPMEAAPAFSEIADESGAYLAQPVYVTVTSRDTVWGLINRYGLTKEKFWEWNGHLWESRGLPKDPDYLQEGWRIRIK